MLPCVSSLSAMEQAQQELLNNPALCQVLFKNLPHLAASSMAARAFGPDERSTSRELVPAHDRDRPPKQRRQQKDLEQDEEMPPTRLPSPSRRPKRTGRRNGSRPRASRNGPQQSKQEVKPTADLLASIILALLNHEDELTALRYHHGWIFYATVHQANSVVPSLARIQQQWKSDQPQDSPGTPVRHALFIGLLHELHTRAQGFDHVAYDSTNQDKESALISLPGALASRGRHHTDENPAFSWNYMRWDAKQRKVVIDAQRPPLSPKVVSTHLAAMLKLDQEQLTKFRPSMTAAHQPDGRKAGHSLPPGTGPDYRRRPRGNARLSTSSEQLNLELSWGHHAQEGPKTVSTDADPPRSARSAAHRRQRGLKFSRTSESRSPPELSKAPSPS